MSTLLELVNHTKVYKNAHRSLLMEKTLQKNEGALGPEGELVILTGLHTGRSANDKYVVMNNLTKNKIWWENNINEMSEEVFQELRTDVVNYFKSQEELFFTERSIGSSSSFSLGIEFISTQASSAFFTQYMFKPFEGEAHNDDYKILHAPNFKLDPKKYGTRSKTVIVTCFKEKTTIIVGTMYSGEIKKSMFSIMNFLLPDVGILPMHSGANQNADNECFVFFGLSGTGKTTLSTDEGLQLIGDDEHGLSDKGIFNFEGGCYAKTYKLSPETEPSIYQASNQYSSFLENVKLADDRSSIDFFDDGLTENGRSSYPLSFIENRVESGEGSIPKNIFYLSADAFGVLPPVSLLNAEQSMDFFKLGYSAKLGGTEVGVKTPTATFSSCFGAPFMLRHPDVYSNLLKEFITKYKIKVWLINTGWFGGSYGTGTRFPLKVTRNIIRQIQADKLTDIEFVNDNIFNLKIPKFIDLVDSSILDPRNAWENQEEYLQVAKNLATSFEVQLKKIKN
ncbi:MAG: phosphoenolpyruvate carboxykinase (ATP) [Bacteriovorax sp.]|nr:phosphoenolpyruvate carboxykinase (ATP) [Bacteriovorax sp.]